MSCPFGTTEVSEETSAQVKNKLQFDKLVSYLKVHFLLLPDSRAGFNTTYHIQEAALSAFSVFFTQCPSFLANQKKMQETKGKNNASSLFQVTDIPSDNQTRNLLDPIAPKHLTPVFEFIYKSLLSSGFLEPYRCCVATIIAFYDDRARN